MGKQSRKKVGRQTVGLLKVEGTATLDGNQTIGGTLAVTGTLGVTGAVTLSSTLGVTGATVLSDTLVVTGNAALKAITTLGTKAISANALLLGSGASATRETTAAANKNFAEFRFESTATSGDSRGIYNRLYLGGAGVSGESLRTFTTVDDVAAATAHGAHNSLNFNATGSITGQGLAVRGTLHIPNQAQSAGTYAAVQAEIWADGSSSDISGTTSHALFRGAIGGDGTGAATVSNFLSLSVPAPGSAAFIDTDKTSESAYAGLAVNIEGVGVKYLRLFDAA